MPIQEYIYDSDDDESRQRAMEDAANAGSLAQFFHAKDTELQTHGRPETKQGLPMSMNASASGATNVNFTKLIRGQYARPPNRTEKDTQVVGYGS